MSKFVRSTRSHITTAFTVLATALSRVARGGGERIKLTTPAPFHVPNVFSRALLLAFCIAATPALATSVVEFYNTHLDNYFITADANEAAQIDGGSAGPGWIRTGNTFNSDGSTSVCRFYGSQSPGPNSHFYTVDVNECEGLKQLQASTPASQKRWNFESLDFVSTPPTNGACSAGTVPVYRAYNNGYSRGVDSNHRITSSLAAIQEVVSRGWNNEGVVMCAPLCAAPQVWNGTACAVSNSVQALTLIAGTANTPGSQNGARLSASFYAPGAMTVDAQGSIYVADGTTGWYDTHGLIRKISPSGDVSTVAGSSFYGYAHHNGSTQDGIGSQAIFGSITGITASPGGNFYTIDPYTSLVQKITPQGNVTTIAGVRNQDGANDGPALTARFQGDGIAADQQGNLFIADTANHTIRKIDVSGIVTTYAGQAGVIGDADGSLQNARFKYPFALKFDSPTGKLFVGDQIGIRVISNGAVSTIIPLQQLMQDVCSVGGRASPEGLDISSDGRIAVAYSNCGRVGIYQNNKLSILLSSYRGFDDVDGAPGTSRFYFPSGLAFLPNGDLVISDLGNRNIKRYSASTNSVSLYAGQRNYINPVDGVGSAAKLDNPFCLARSPTGDIWFSQNVSVVRKINAAGNVTTLLSAPNDGACVLKVNEDGSFITAAQYKNELRLYGPTGAFLRTLATQIEFPFPLSSAVYANGDIFFNDKSGFIRKYSPSTGAISIFSDTPIGSGSVSAMAITSTGDIIAADPCSLFKVSASGVVAPFTGAASRCAYKDGTTAQAGFPNIQGLAVGANDAIYVSDHGVSVIRRIYNGNVDTIAGTPWLNETSIGTGQGSIYDPRGIAYDAASNSLIIMTGNAILRAQLP